jgi:hypothetical protein
VFAAGSSGASIGVHGRLQPILPHSTPFPEAVQRFQAGQVVLALDLDHAKAVLGWLHNSAEAISCFPGLHCGTHHHGGWSVTYFWRVVVYVQASVAIAIMFTSYVLHTGASPYMHRENIPKPFFDIVNRDIISSKDVCGGACFSVCRHWEL